MRDFIVSDTLSSALGLLEEHGDQARIIAGGTDLWLSLKDGNQDPAFLIDISRLKELAYIRDERSLIRIGALTTHSELLTSPLIQAKVPLLAEAVAQIGSPQVRNRGTIAGNLANASPAADAAVVLIALDAGVVILSKNGRREMSLDSFFLGPNRTALKDNELIAEIVIPMAQNRLGAFLKLAQRRSLATSIVNAAATFAIDNGLFRYTRIATGAVAPVPLRCRRAEAAFNDQPVTDQVIKTAAREIRVEVSPIDDIRGSAGYRKQMAQVLVERAIKIALDRGSISWIRD